VTCPLFVELCAGTAALSLRLHHPRARPPVSRMGAKTGYADVILRCMGLRPGQGSADGTRYLWCEPDKGVRLLLHSYRDRAVSLAAAEIIRGWKDEEPRALWERLRAEGPAVCPPVDPREVAKFLRLLTSNRLIPGTWSEDGRWVNAAPQSGGASFGGADFCTDAAALATAINDTPTLPATITADARDIDPREVARYARILTANRLVNPDPETWRNTGRGGYRHGGAEFCTPAADLAARFADAVEVPRAAVVDDARKVEPPQLPPGVVAYIDPPYENTTGYSHKFPRGAWLPIVRRWAEAGALVVVSEAEPIPELVAEGWHAVEITGERKGQKRTFSKQQREWLTMSRAPAWKPSEQMGLFDGRS
jgi:hypothetical protein